MHRFKYRFEYLVLGISVPACRIGLQEAWQHTSNNTCSNDKMEDMQRCVVRLEDVSESDGECGQKCGQASSVV